MDKKAFTVLCMSSLLSATALAAVNADEAKQLGGSTLTVFGAEKAGNKDGTIPAYSGEKIPLPASFNPKNPSVRPDPYASEKPLYQITAQNMDKYADILNDGTKAMLKKYPGFRVDVYPTHRNVRYPAYVLENTQKNATACKATNGGVSLDGCYGGIPFPIPKTGNEVMWNHIQRWQTSSAKADAWYQFVTSSGNLTVQGAHNCMFEYPFFYDDKKVRTGEDPYYKVRCDAFAPTRKAGEKIVVVDHVDNRRRAYQYIPGQRRVKLAPDLAYDTPNPSAGGTSTMDDVFMFFGAQDRFDFKLIGKKEMLIPYNNFKLFDKSVCSAELAHKPKYLNPDCVRYELHRTWVVEAKLKPEFRHIYKKRVFYFDEDNAGLGVADNYDAAGALYRMSTVFHLPWYETPDQQQTDSFAIFDLQVGAYMTDINYVTPTARAPETTFSGEALAGEGVR